MARSRSEHFPEIQRTILANSARCFARQGYARSSISDLADACQLSRGALYHYFQSKEAILFGILDAHIRDLISKVEATAARPDAPADQFRNVILTMIDTYAMSQNEQVVLMNDLSYLSPVEQRQIKDLERRLVELIGDILLRLDATGRINRSNKKVYTMMLFGILNFTYTWYNPAGPVAPADFAAMAADLFLNGFVSAPSGGQSA